MDGPSPEDLEIVRGLIGRLADRLGPALLRAALFGSRARGRAWPGSDYDVFLVVEREDPPTRAAIYDVAYDLSPLDFNFHIYTPGRLEAAMRLDSPVLRAVELEGVHLWPTPASKRTG